MLKLIFATNNEFKLKGMLIKYSYLFHTININIFYTLIVR